MDYQFSSFEQWSVTLRCDTFVRPPITVWCKQLLDAKLKVLNHFMRIGEEIKKPKLLEEYITRHYQSLSKIISEIAFCKDVYHQIMLKSLEQIRFFIELHFPDFIPSKDEFHITTTLSMEEFAQMLNLMMEKELIKTKSRKELARHVSKYVLFENMPVKATSTDEFYKVMLHQQRLKLGDIEERSNLLTPKGQSKK